MAERCQLCGARWEGEATACRECGAPRRTTIPPDVNAPVAAPSGAVAAPSGAVAAPSGAVAAPSGAVAAPSGAVAAPSGAVPMAAPPPVVVAPLAVPVPVPPGVSQPIAPLAGRRTLLLVAAAGVAVAVAVGATAWLATDSTEVEATLDPLQVNARDLSGCEQLQALAGAWVFTTATTGARRKQRLGTRGFYQLEIEVESCTARASMAKTGRTDRVVFDDHKVPRAEATLAPGAGAEAYGWTGAFVLRNEDGQGIDTQFVFSLDGERLVGSWRQLGERWTQAGLYGVLEGQREGDPTAIEPSRSTQPCKVRCATPEDISMLDAPDPVTHAACLASCE